MFSLSEINEVKDAESKIYSSLTYKVLDSSTDFNTSKTVYVSLPASSHQNMKEITYNFEILEERISDLYDNLKDTEKSAKEENISKDDLEELADLKAKARNLRGRIKTLENRLEELSIANDIEVPDAEADDNFYELSLDKITPFVRQNYVTPLK